MNYENAARIARDLAQRLDPHCERVEIAGGVRRRKAEPHDIDLVVAPKMAPVYDLFGHETGERDLLHECLADLVASERLRVGPKQGPKFKQFQLPSGIMLELSVVRYPAQFGVLHAIRTGPAHYSHWLVTQRAKGGPLPNEARVSDGAVWVENDPVPLPMETEEAFFAFLDIPMPAPSDRTPRWWKA